MDPVSGNQGKRCLDDHLPDLVPAAVAIEVIAAVANVLSRPGEGESEFDSPRRSDTSSSAAARTCSSVTAGGPCSIASASVRACSTFRWTLTVCVAPGLLNATATPLLPSMCRYGFCTSTTPGRSRTDLPDAAYFSPWGVSFGRRTILYMVPVPST